MSTMSAQERELKGLVSKIQLGLDAIRAQIKVHEALLLAAATMVANHEGNNIRQISVLRAFVTSKGEPVATGPVPQSIESPLSLTEQLAHLKHRLEKAMGQQEDATTQLNAVATQLQAINTAVATLEAQVATGADTVSPALSAAIQGVITASQGVATELNIPAAGAASGAAGGVAAV